MNAAESARRGLFGPYRESEQARKDRREDHRTHASAREGQLREECEALGYDLSVTCTSIAASPKYKYEYRLVDVLGECGHVARNERELRAFLEGVEQGRRTNRGGEEG